MPSSLPSKFLQFFVLTLCVLGTRVALCEESDVELHKIKEKREVRAVRFSVNGDYVTMSRAGASLGGIGLAAGVQGAFADEWAVNGQLRQGFSMSGLVNIFTSVEIGVSYALTGTLRSRIRTLDVGARQISEFSEYYVGGWRAQLYAMQYYFNAPSFSVPFSGLGGAVAYEFSSSSWYNLKVGARIDRVGNGKINLYPMQLFAGILIWL